MKLTYAIKTPKKINKAWTCTQLEFIAIPPAFTVTSTHNW